MFRKQDNELMPLFLEGLAHQAERDAELFGPPGTPVNQSLARLGAMVNRSFGNTGEMFPISDVVELQLGARFIPGEVTLARRRGEAVAFDQGCRNQCCWFWRFPDGRRVYHWERGDYRAIAEANGRQPNEHGDYDDAGPCPSCGNRNTSGGTVPR